MKLNKMENDKQDIKIKLLNVIIENLISIIFIICGTILGLNGVEGWGWLIFLSMLFIVDK